MSILNRSWARQAAAALSLAVVLAGTASLLAAPKKGGAAKAPKNGDAAAEADTGTGGPWPADVQGYVPLAPGEHPRLLFRKSDLPALKQKAQTPEGQAILKRLRATLDGANGDTFPKVFNASGGAYAGNKPVSEDEAGTKSNEGKSNKNAGKSQEMPLGAYSMSHAAGYGLLYQLTGDKKYADLGRESFEKAFGGMRDRDDRYSFRNPGGALRAGPSMGWYALGYDLCYDGWDDAFRQKVAEEIGNYPGGDRKDPNSFIENCILGKRQHPGSNHWGMEVGGSAMAMLAIYGDPGCDMAKFKPLYDASQKIMIRNMTEGFGNGGFFAEGDGTGSMSSHIVFLPALQAWKTAAGKDFISPRPNAQWMADKWFLLTISNNGKPDFWPQRGAYPHNIWARAGLSGGGYFSIGQGVATSNDVKDALLWYYDHYGFKAVDEKNGTPYDTPSPYPHHSVLSFVNWAVGQAEKDPDSILPHAMHDAKWGFYAWRNRWDDNQDVVVSILTKGTKGNYGCKAESTLSINNGGKHLTWGNIKGGFSGDFKPSANGSTILTVADGSVLGLDFSGASGSAAVLVLAGAEVPKSDAVVTVSDKPVSFLFLGKGEAVKPEVQGDKITVGGQTMTFDGKTLTFTK